MNTLQAECTYMTDGVTMPFCKGCGHSQVLKKLNDALTILKLDPMDVCLVTDIGCIGLADALFDKVHTVHTTHGRSTGFATGIALADKVLAEKKLKTIVLIGDGGSMIGLLHIVNAALLNTDVTVIVANNFLFGMTGGQQSSFSPLDFITQTSPSGTIVPPLDICKTVQAAKAEFIARTVSSDKELSNIFADAIAHEGFALVEVLELCTEHATTKNEIKGNTLKSIAENEGQELGLISNGNSRKEFAQAYFNINKPNGSNFNLFEGFIQKNNDSNNKLNITKQTGFVIAGSAGEKVQSSAAKLCKLAASFGYFTTQKNDNPVTQGSGFSLSEVIISPDEIYYTGVEQPDIVIIISGDGLREAVRQNVFERADDNTILYIDDTLDEPDSKGVKIKKDFRSNGAINAAWNAIETSLEEFRN